MGIGGPLLPSSELEALLDVVKTLFLVEVTGPLLTTVRVTAGPLEVVTLLLRTDRRSLPVRTSLLLSSTMEILLTSPWTPLPVLVMVEGKLRKMLLELVELLLLAGMFSWGTGLDTPRLIRPTTSTATLLNMLSCESVRCP